MLRAFPHLFLKPSLEVSIITLISQERKPRLREVSYFIQSHTVTGEAGIQTQMVRHPDPCTYAQHHTASTQATRGHWGGSSGNWKLLDCLTSGKWGKGPEAAQACSVMFFNAETLLASSRS